MSVPAMFRTAAMFGDNILLLPLFLQISDTRHFVGEPLHEIQHVDSATILLDYFIILHYK